MADDTEIADQEEPLGNDEETELSESELENLFNEEDPEVDPAEGEADDEEGESAEVEPTDDDDDEEESEEDEEESEEDEAKAKSVTDEIKEMAAKGRQANTETAVAEAAEKARAEAMKASTQAVLENLFADGEDVVKIGDKEVDLKGFADEYGEEIDLAIKARAAQAALQLHKESLENNQFVSKDELATMQNELADMRFKSEIAQVHPEIWELENNENFWKWADEQGEDTLYLLDHGGKPGICKVIEAYKQATVKTKNKAIDKVAATKKEKHDNLHTSTTRSKTKVRKSSKKSGDQLMSDKERAEFFNKAKI